MEDTRTGWVYRSDTQGAAHPSAAAIAAPPRFVPSLAPRPAAAAPPRPAPPGPPPGWVAAAMTLMSLPFFIAAGMMIAPVALVCAARKPTNG